MTAGLRIDGDRLRRRLDELGRLTSTPGNGVTREAWGVHDVQARDLVAGWMLDSGLEPTVDAAANLIGRRPGRTPRWLAAGSHLDTVVHGGALDGAYGVVAALEAVASLHDAGHATAHGLLVAGFANEEGARGTSGMTGSYACIGGVDRAALDQVDDEGVTVGDRIATAGGDPEQIATARWATDQIDGFVELHIEQGPVLDRSGVSIGVVSGITGRQALEVRLTGAANHAGTTPMELRHDALTAAAEIVLLTEGLPAETGIRVATCGHLAVSPNVRNVVPGEVVLGIELRDESDAAIDSAMTRLVEAIETIAARRGVTVVRSRGQRVPPRRAEPGIATSMRRAAAMHGLRCVELPSGAGHDAQVLAEVVPIGMIFVPSIGGVSHSPRERTDPQDLVAGAQVLLTTLLDLDERVHEVAPKGAP